MAKYDYVSLKAEKAIVNAGGSVDEGGTVSWPTGTKFRDDQSIRRGGWGNFTYECRELPNGILISWDSDDRQYRVAINNTARLN